MDNQQKKRERREIYVMDDKKLHLYAKPLQEGAYSPRLRVLFKENNPCIEVNCGTKTEKNYAITIEAPMAPLPFRTLMMLIEKVAASKQPCAFEMDNWGYPFIWDRAQGKNVRSKERLIISRTSVMKREDGVVAIALAAKNKPTVQFEFQSDEFHPILQNGQTLDVGITSSMAAAAWASQMKDIVTSCYVDNWAEPEYEKKRRLERMQNNQNGQGNRYQNQSSNNRGSQQNSNGQNSQQPSASYQDNDDDDDIPF